MEEEIQEEIQEEDKKPLIINTRGRWQPFEAYTGIEFEIGKSYKIDVEGVCEFSVSNEKPTAGIKTKSIQYTKSDSNTLWIKTGV